jgi:hypothetical protein
MGINELLEIIQIDAQDIPLIADRTWYIKSNGYIASDRSKDGVRVHTYLHRLIMDAEKGLVVDHINGDIKDNRRVNLRVVDYSTNLRNRHKDVTKLVASRRGVFYRPERKKWQAKYVVRGKRFTVGSFSTEEDAYAALEAHKRQNGVNV